MTTTYERSTSTPETVVDDLWREGWFIRSAKAMVRTIPTLDADDVASDAVFAGIYAAKSWRGADDPDSDIQAWVKWRSRMRMKTYIGRHLDALKYRARGGIDGTEGMDNALIDSVYTAPGADEEAETRALAEAQERVWVAMATLTDKQREYVLLRFFQDAKPCTPEHQNMPKKPGGGIWDGAKVKLQRQLADLAWMVD